MERSADYYLLLLPLGWVFTLHGTVKADCSLLNFHWFPPDGLWGFESRPPSIRKDVKYRGRWTITEEEEKRRRSVEGRGVSFRVKMIVLKCDKNVFVFITGTQVYVCEFHSCLYFWPIQMMELSIRKKCQEKYKKTLKPSQTHAGGWDGVLSLR